MSTIVRVATSRKRMQQSCEIFLTYIVVITTLNRVKHEETFSKVCHNTAGVAKILQLFQISFRWEFYFGFSLNLKLNLFHRRVTKRLLKTSENISVNQGNFFSKLEISLLACLAISCNKCRIFCLSSKFQSLSQIIIAVIQIWNSQRLFPASYFLSLLKI